MHSAYIIDSVVSSVYIVNLVVSSTANHIQSQSLAIAQRLSKFSKISSVVCTYNTFHSELAFELQRKVKFYMHISKTRHRAPPVQTLNSKIYSPCIQSS